MQDKIGFSINGESWDAEKNPVDTGFPGFVDRWLNGQVARGNANIKRLKQDPAAFKAAVLAAAPTTLFVLVPVFALMAEAGLRVPVPAAHGTPGGGAAQPCLPVSGTVAGAAGSTSSAFFSR